LIRISWPSDFFATYKNTSVPSALIIYSPLDLKFDDIIARFALPFREFEYIRKANGLKV
jgi:hypothetical protein